MSDFLYSTERREPGALGAALRPWVGPLGLEPEERHGPWGTLALARPDHEAYALHETGDALTLVIGHPTVAPPDGSPALIGYGDRRDWLHRALEEPRRCVDALDGHFGALRIEKGTKHGGAGPGPDRGGVSGSVLTDRFGFVDLYEARGPDGGLVIGTHADAVAAATGRADRIDPVAVADACVNFVSTYPRTIYDGVALLPPAAIRWFDAGGWTGPTDVHWRPWEAGLGPHVGASPGLGELAERLRAGVVASVEAATAGVHRAAVLLSGGEDSRTVLAAVPERVEIRGVVYAEWESREMRIARRVGRAHGARVDRATRPHDHYSARFPDMARIAGSTHQFTDIHGLGLDISPPLATFPVVLGGLSADSLVKACHAPKHTGFRSPRLPGLRPDLLEAVDERRSRHLEWLRRWRPETADEWMWLWPFAMRHYSGNVAGARRQFRSWQPYHSTAVLDVAAVAPQRLKRRRRLFRRAMRPLLRRTAWVPHARHHFPYLGPVGNVLAVPWLEAGRAVRDLVTRERGLRHKSWPPWGAVARSPGMREQERSLPVVDTPLGEIFERAQPAAVDGARAQWTSLSRLKLVELAYLLEVHREG
jgi:hypothetical protein